MGVSNGKSNNDDAWQSTAKWINSAVEKHISYRRWTLNLIASENVMSPDVAQYYNLELGHRYGNYEGINVADRKYLGNKYLVDLEARAIKDACELFHAGAADLRSLSGHVAGSAIIMGLCKQGDLVLELDSAAGGHRLTEKLCKARIIDLRIEPVPFDGLNFQVDVEATVKIIKQKKPRLVILGSSNYLFPTPIDEIASACHDCQATLLVDTSHVMGLIAGGAFPQPMDSGADLILSSTHKTLSGPQGGIILGKTPGNLEQMIPALFPGLVTNHHLMRIPAMIALFAEWKTFGCEYAKAVIENAIAMANELDNIGCPVIRTAQGPTLSHTILIKTSRMSQSSKEIAAGLEDCGIIVGATTLPPEHGGEGLRIGVQEVTRMGLKTEQIPEMAKLISDAIGGQAKDDIIQRVKNFTKSLQTVHYCYSHSS